MMDLGLGIGGRCDADARSNTLAAVTIETLRQICRALPAVTEDVKWGADLCFSVAGKMFVVVNLEPPHQVAFKCTAESFGELIEREGIIPAPYMARNMWVQEQALGETIERGELQQLIRTSYDLVVDKLPKSKRPGAAAPDRQRPRRSPKARTRRRHSR
jgi:predicted DNA-binding protein (MmcQ/YjbR family)